MSRAKDGLYYYIQYCTSISYYSIMFYWWVVAISEG